jgi:hypothetical protein
VRYLIKWNFNLIATLTVKHSVSICDVHRRKRRRHLAAADTMELLPVTDTLVAVLYADPHCYRVGKVAELRRRESRNQVAIMEIFGQPRKPRSHAVCC